MKTFYTAIVIILSLSLSNSAKAHTLPTAYKLADVSATIQGMTVKYDAVKKVNTIKWESKNFADVNHFIVESSVNGVDFKIIGYVFAGEVENYAFKNATTDKVIYRVLAISKEETVISVSEIK